MAGEIIFSFVSCMLGLKSYNTHSYFALQTLLEACYVDSLTFVGVDALPTVSIAFHLKALLHWVHTRRSLEHCLIAYPLVMAIPELRQESLATPSEGMRLLFLPNGMVHRRLRDLRDVSYDCKEYVLVH